MAIDDTSPEYPIGDDPLPSMRGEIVNTGTHRPASPDFIDMLRDRERAHAEVMEERRLKEQGAILWREREGKQARRKVAKRMGLVIAAAFLTAVTQQVGSTWLGWIWQQIMVRTAP